MLPTVVCGVSCVMCAEVSQYGSRGLCGWVGTLKSAEIQHTSAGQQHTNTLLNALNIPQTYRLVRLWYNFTHALTRIFTCASHRGTEVVPK